MRAIHSDKQNANRAAKLAAHGTLRSLASSWAYAYEIGLTGSSDVPAGTVASQLLTDLNAIGYFTPAPFVPYGQRSK